MAASGLVQGTLPCHCHCHCHRHRHFDSPLVDFSAFLFRAVSGAGIFRLPGRFVCIIPGRRGVGREYGWMGGGKVVPAGRRDEAVGCGSISRPPLAPPPGPQPLAAQLQFGDHSFQPLWEARTKWHGLMWKGRGSRTHLANFHAPPSSSLHHFPSSPIP